MNGSIQIRNLSGIERQVQVKVESRFYVLPPLHQAASQRWPKPRNVQDCVTTDIRCRFDAVSMPKDSSMAFLVAPIPGMEARSISNLSKNCFSVL